MRKSRLSAVIFVALLLFLLYALYIVLGGDFSFMRGLRSGSGTGNLLEPITNGLSALGRGLTDVFTSILP